MPDQFDDYKTGLTSPGKHAASVTPTDGVDLAEASRALWVGAAGDLTVTMIGGDVVTFTNLQVGWHPIRVGRVHATGTTAADITIIW